MSKEQELLSSLKKVSAIQQDNSGSHRVYHTPDGSYKSVTTFLGQVLPKDSLEEWRASVGYDAANRATKAGIRRGNFVHNYIEEKLIGNILEVPFKYRDLIGQIDSHLSKIDEVYSIEQSLYSNKLRLAGSVDLICKFEGKICILDWKTGRAPLNDEAYYQYFLQETIYAMMVKELTGVSINNIVTCFVFEESPPMIIRNKTKDYVDDVIDLIRSNRDLL